MKVDEGDGMVDTMPGWRVEMGEARTMVSPVTVVALPARKTAIVGLVVGSIICWCRNVAATN
jgi:hypothetical protein